MKRLFSRIMKQFLQTTLRSEAFRQTAITLVGNTFATGLSAIAIILITRLLGPSLFGEFSVGFSIVLIMTRLSDLGLSTSLIKFGGASKNKSEANKYFSVTTKLKLFSGLVVVGLVLLFSRQLADLFQLTNPQIIAISAVFGLVNIFYEQLVIMLQSMREFSRAVFVNFLQAATKLITAGIYFSSQTNALVVLYTSFLAAPLTPLAMYRLILPDWVQVSPFKSYPKQLKKIVAMSKHTAAVSLSAGMMEHVSILFVQGYLNSYQTGLLSGISKITMLFTLISISLGNVLFPRVARYKKNADLTAYFKKAVIISVLALLSFFAFLPLTKLSILVTIGSQYLDGIFYLYILMAAVCIAIATIPFTAFFYSFDAPWYFSFVGITQLVLIIIGNWIFVPMYGLIASVVTVLIIRILVFVFTLGMVIKLMIKKNSSQSILHLFR